MTSPIDPRLITRAKATKPFMIGLVCLGIVTGGLVLVQAWLLSQGIAAAFYTHSIEVIIKLLPWIITLFLVRALLAWLNEWLAHRAGAAVKSTLRRDIMKARMVQPINPNTSSASLVNLVTTNLNDLDGYFSKFLPQLFLAATVPIILLVPIYFVDLTSGLIITVTIPLIPLFMILIGINTRTQVAKRFKVQYRLANHFADLVQGLPTLQVFGRAKTQVKGLKLSENANRKETMRTLIIAFLSAGVLELAATISVALVAVTIGLRVVFAQMDLYPALFVLIAAPEVYLPIRMVGTHFHDSQNGLAAANRAFKIIEEGELAPTGGSRPLPSGQLNVVAENVDYTYPGAKTPTLKNFNLQLNPGKMVALIGKTGAGKSTVLSLILGLTSPDKGVIKINGEDLLELDRSQWLNQIAWVGQNPAMILGTVADNVRLGNETATDQQIRLTLDQVGAESLALEHLVGDDGEGLSAGERRRVGLARALLKISSGAQILVLDEPTAGLDTTTEIIAITSVKKLGISTLLVTHRQPVIDMADEIVYLQTQELAVSE